MCTAHDFIRVDEREPFSNEGKCTEDIAMKTLESFLILLDARYFNFDPFNFQTFVVASTPKPTDHQELLNELRVTESEPAEQLKSAFLEMLLQEINSVTPLVKLVPPYMFKKLISSC